MQGCGLFLRALEFSADLDVYRLVLTSGGFIGYLNRLLTPGTRKTSIIHAEKATEHIQAAGLGNARCRRVHFPVAVVSAEADHRAARG